MLPLVPGLFWSGNSQLAASSQPVRIKESPLWFIVATYFSLELLYSGQDNAAVRHRHQSETKGESRET